MFKTRLISTIVIIIALVALIFFLPPDIFALVLMFASIIGMFELFRATNVLKDGRKIDLLTGISYFAVIVYYVCGWLFKGNMQYQMMVIAIYLIVLMGVYVLKYPQYDAISFVFSFFGFIYLGVMLSFVYFTRILPNGMLVVGLSVLSSWLCDVCAYCVGMLIGKHKMAPILSPKKSIEGAVGGFLGSALLGALYGYLVTPYMSNSSKNYAVMFGIICAFGSLASMIGDLTASAIKRQFDIKDYGKLIPGHGGILDRFDSLIVTAPIIYCLACILI